MRVLLKGGRVIDGLGHLKENTDVLIDGHKIEAIGENLTERAEPVDDTINVSARTVMPGLIDCHVHITMGSVKSWVESERQTEQETGFLQSTPLAVRDVLAGIYNARQNLEAGYTTVRDMGVASDFSDIVLSHAIRRGFVPGPRLLSSGGGIAMTGGHGTNHPGVREVDGLDEALKLARLQLKAGADVLKIFATRAGSAKEQPGGSEFSVDEMQVICEEAQKRGKRVAAHAVGAEGIKNSIIAGVDTIEHGCFLDQECIDLMLARGRYLTCTLFPYQHQARISVEHGYPEYVSTRSLEIMDVYPANIRRAWDQGVKMALGSDCGIPKLTPHGQNAVELEMIVNLVGLNEMETIGLATRGGAELLGLEHDIGTLETGKLADILVVNGDPLSDITVLQDRTKISLVFKEGQPVVKEGLAVWD